MSSASHASPHHSVPGAGDPTAHAHVVTPRVLLTVWAMLVTLTIITVAVAYLPLGDANIYVALAIAVVKATIVVLYFMHLRWDSSPFNSVALIAALIFVAVFISATIGDSANYSQFLNRPSNISAP